ncbi:MAG: deoxyribonuclease IV [Acidobacteriota bacterium]
MPPRFGAHMSIAGGVDLAVERAAIVGCDALQLFTSSSNQWKARPLREDEIARFREGVERHGLAPVIAHDSYLINVGSPDDALWRRSLDALAEEYARCEALGIAYLVMHPGAHVGSGEDAAIGRIAAAIDEVLSAYPRGRTMILLENTAGQGTVLGHRFEQLARIRRAVRARRRVGYCVDTQHSFAAGWDLSDAEGYARWVADIERVLGLGNVRALHLNDSKSDCGSRVDRHEHIGLGRIGAGGFWRLANDPRFDGLPASIETEKGDDCAEDFENLAVLRALVGRKRVPTAAQLGKVRERARERAQKAAPLLAELSRASRRRP